MSKSFNIDNFRKGKLDGKLMTGAVLLFFVLLLLGVVNASAVECPPGFKWVRMSGVGCVQENCMEIENAKLSYTSSCICIDGYKGCYEPVDYTNFDKSKCGPNCPYSRLIACVKPGEPCPGKEPEKEEERIEEDGIDEVDKDVIKPDNTSCKDFYVDSKDFDLAYDNKMLRKEFLYFLYDYGSKHELKSASEKYDAEWFSSDFFMLEAFLFTDDIKEWRFLTGKEDNLGKRIDERFKKEGRPLKPAEVFEESLKINDNCVFDALLTAHNYLKKQCHDLRFTKRKDWKGNYDSAKKNIEKLEIKLEGKGVLDPFGQIIESPYLDKDAQETIKLLDKFKKQFEEMENFKKNAETPFKELKQLRSKEDNEGAWYHLFLTATMGYGERKYEWDCPWEKTVRNIVLEHRIYKGIFEWKWFEIDNVEYCWDVWGAYLGCEIYSTLLDNQEKVKDRIKEHPEVWVKGEWDPSYILDAYTGQKIYE